MDLLILTTALDKSAAAMTSITNATALIPPGELPQLVIGTTEPITLKFLTAVSTYETWTADATYTMKVDIGALTANGLKVYASATIANLISNGKSGSIALTTAALVTAISADFARWNHQSINPLVRCRAPFATLILQVTVTDPAAAKRVFAQFPVTVNGTVPAFIPS